jgi:hypothetical protein
MTLGWIGGVIWLVCHIWIIVLMFQHGQIALGILSIVLTFCLIGLFVTFIYGWVKASPWNIKNLMMIYTVGVVLDLAGNALAPPDISAIQRQLQGQP